MKTYHILEVSGSFYVQFIRRGQWLFYRGQNHLRFDTWMDAYTWIVQKKLNGNYALAQLTIS